MVPRVSYRSRSCESGRPHADTHIRFPEYKTSSDEISVWGTSVSHRISWFLDTGHLFLFRSRLPRELTYVVQYAGFWAPGFLSHFITQNDAINAGTHPDKNATALNLSTLGLGNACIDSLVQGPGFLEFAVNNTYGFQAYSEEVYEMAAGNLTAPGTGCIDLIEACRETAGDKDPGSFGTDAETNEACVAATAVCYGAVQGAFTEFSDVSYSSPALIVWLLGFWLKQITEGRLRHLSC